jgi:hypothetical protein
MKKFSIWLKDKNWFEDNTIISATPKPTQVLATTPQKTPPPAAATLTYVPNDQQINSYHQHPIVDRLLHVVKTKIDGLTWDYGKDSVEMAIASALDAVPHMKAHCDRLTGCWKQFKNALYSHLKENEQPWWGPPRSGSPNPVKYDTVLLNLRDLEKIFETQFKYLLDSK